MYIPTFYYKDDRRFKALDKCKKLVINPYFFLLGIVSYLFIQIIPKLSKTLGGNYKENNHNLRVYIRIAQKSQETRPGCIVHVMMHQALHT